MPTYKYRCEAGHEWEEVQSMHDEAYDRCRAKMDCGARARRVPVKGLGFVLKGGGWAKDGYSK